MRMMRTLSKSPRCLIFSVAFAAAMVFAACRADAQALSKPVNDNLPVPILEKSPRLVNLYWKAWSIALGKVRKPRPGSHFVSDYMDEGFSDNIFQWDTCFMVMFGRYGQDALPGVKSFDNFYARQHEDGFIDREIRETDGTDYWGPNHNNSINPPLYSWAEWETYKITGDAERLKRSFPHLKKYYKWIRANRRLPSGLYWTTDLASGMDNSPRNVPDGMSSDLSYGYSWVDLTAQQALNAWELWRIAELIGNKADAEYFLGERHDLEKLVNDNFWDEKTGMYYDLNAKGKLTRIKTIASFWPMLAGIVPPARAKRLVENHLMNKREFWRPHPFPTLSFDNMLYNYGGGYWRGAVWAPTEYMIIRGLENYGYEDLATEAVERHLKNMSDVFLVTGTIYENYAPEMAAKGSPAMGDFVGWSGIGPIAMLIENIIGLRADAPNDSLAWRLRRTDRHGIEKFHFGDNHVSIVAEARDSATAPISISVKTDSPFVLAVDLPQGMHAFNVKVGQSQLTVP